MNRQQWRDLLEAIGFLAIIGSLYFVGVETQNSARQTAQNTQAVEIAAYQALTANIAQNNAIGVADENAAAILVEMRDGPADGAQRMQLFSEPFPIKFKKVLVFSKYTGDQEQWNILFFYLSDIIIPKFIFNKNYNFRFDDV